MSAEVIKLSIKFFEEIKEFAPDLTGKIKAPDSYKKHIMKNIQELISGGMKSSYIAESMDNFKRNNSNYQEVYNIDAILKELGITITRKAIKKDPKNILESGKFYYHPELQIVPPPPVIIQNDDGSFTTSYDEDSFYLEIRESYTYDDLTEYFYRKMKMENNMYKERDIGAFKYLLEGADIDLILYTIDESRALSQDRGARPITNVFEIRNYISDGQDILELRKNNCKQGGFDRVIPRRFS